MPTRSSVAEVAEPGWTYHVAIDLMRWRQRWWIVKALRNWYNWWLRRWRCVMRWTTWLVDVWRCLITLRLRCEMMVCCRWWRCTVVGWARRSCRWNVLHSWWCWRWVRVVVCGYLISPIRTSIRSSRRRWRLPSGWRRRCSRLIRRKWSVCWL